MTRTATEGAGTTSTVTIGPISVDKTAPTTTASVSGTAGLNGWYVGPVAVTLAAADALSGVVRTEYSLDGSAWIAAASLTFSADGVHTVEGLRNAWDAVFFVGQPHFRALSAWPSVLFLDQKAAGSNPVAPTLME